MDEVDFQLANHVVEILHDLIKHVGYNRDGRNFVDYFTFSKATRGAIVADNFRLKEETFVCLMFKL